MRPWALVATAEMPGGGGVLRLQERDGEFSLRLGRRELMTSLAHASEEALGELAGARLASRPAARVLIGGLGMGYTLAAVLRRLGPQASVRVAELVPAVIAWNRGPIAHLAGRPLEDPRVDAGAADVAALLRGATGAFDAILLDVDNGPEAASRPANAWLYGAEGLRAARAALREEGVLAVWSASAERAFPKRLRAAGFRVEEQRLAARPGRRAARHVVWVATRRDPGRFPPRKGGPTGYRRR